MKKIFYLVAILATVCACSKEGTSEPAEVSVSIDYALPESGSMGRGGADLYSDFYDAQIATRKLTPSTYQITFTNTVDQSTVTIKDQWSKKHALKLLTGTYKVTGTSASIASYNGGGIDTLFLKFDEEIVVDANTSKITLNALYDSFMIFFDASDINKAVYNFNGGGYYGSDVAMKQIDQIYYCFMDEPAKEDFIQISRTSGSATVKVGKMSLEKGKYYYFGDLSSEYNLPEMEGGN